MAKNLHDKQNYNPFRLTSEERAEMDPNYKKPKKKVWNLWFEKTLILSNIFFVTLLQITQKKSLWKRELFLSIPCSFYHSYPLHVRITHDQLWRLKKIFFTYAEIYITNIYFKICMNGLAILSANHRHLQCTRLQLPYPKSHYKYMDRNTFYILCCT